MSIPCGDITLSKVLRSEVEEAVEHILGKELYKILCENRTDLPTAMDTAVRKCFVQQISGPAVEILREGVKILAMTGKLTNDED